MPILASFAEIYTRSFTSADSEAWFGPNIVIAIVRPFTPGEDLVAEWIINQDGTQLLDVVPLKDGRDFCVFERLYTKQSRQAALREVDEYWIKVVTQAIQTAASRD